MVSLKAQQAIEYLITYGWAILIMLAAVAILFWSGVLNPKTPYSSTCIFPADVSCRAAVLNTSGNIGLDFGQATGHPINVTRFRCTQEKNPSLGSSDNLPSPVTIYNGGHANITDGSQVCYKLDENGSPVVATGRAGNVYRGRIYIVYVELDTGFTHQVVGDVTLKYEDVVIQ